MAFILLGQIDARKFGFVRLPRLQVLRSTKFPPPTDVTKNGLLLGSLFTRFALGAGWHTKERRRRVGNYAVTLLARATTQSEGKTKRV
jgi:hypothetical protein